MKTTIARTTHFIDQGLRSLLGAGIGQEGQKDGAPLATNVFACCHPTRPFLGCPIPMRFWSRYFIPTLKESPSDAEIASHRLLIRSGLVRKLGGGLYTFLPLGLRVMQKISRICREEMERSGAIELQMPSIHPAELWANGPRWGPVREIMYRVDNAGEGKRAPRE